MPISNFDGETFVAFIDISGLKKMMRNKGGKAWRALDAFYNAGYDFLRTQLYPDYKIEGLFVSDCGVLFVNHPNISNSDKINSLISILSVIQLINTSMLQKKFMLTSSVSFGKFKYQERIEFTGIEKNLIYGNAYVAAFLNNEFDKPKILPGQCRIVRNNFPFSNVGEILSFSNYQILKMIKERAEDSSHLYFYWMKQSEDEIIGFEREYSDYKRLSFNKMLNALRG